MHNRRLFCRVVFVLLGLLPLMASLLYAGWRNHQYDAEHCADLLGRSLGFTATVEDVRYTSPGAMRLTNVALCDPEQGRCLLSCDVVSVEQTARAIRVQVPRGVVHAASGDQILYALHERLLKQPALLEKEFEIELASLQMEQAPDAQFVNSTIQLRQIEYGTELRAALFPSGSNPDEQPIDVVIRRDRSQAEQTTVLLQTWDHVLPTGLIAGQREWIPNLSPTTTFRGNIECHLDETGWSGDVLGGNLSNVDLGAFLGTGFGGWVQGLASFNISTLKFQADRIRELNVDVLSYGGRIAVEQLRNAESEWQLVWDREPNLVATPVEYQSLAMGIDLKAGELLLRGRGDPKSTILRLASGEALRTSAAYAAVAQPVSGILAVLKGASTANEASRLGSETAEAEFLRGVLPLPSIHQGSLEQ